MYNLHQRDKWLPYIIGMTNDHEKEDFEIEEVDDDQVCEKEDNAREDDIIKQAQADETAGKGDGDVDLNDIQLDPKSKITSS